MLNQPPLPPPESCNDLPSAFHHVKSNVSFRGLVPDPYSSGKPSWIALVTYQLALVGSAGLSSISTFSVSHVLDFFSCHNNCSVQFSCSFVSDSLWPLGLQRARLPSPSPTPWACSNSCPSSWWCHPFISSSVIPFSSCLQSCPASGSFPMSLFIASDGLRTGVSVSASVLPVNIQDWFSLGLTVGHNSQGPREPETVRPGLKTLLCRLLADNIFSVSAASSAKWES